MTTYKHNLQDDIMGLTHCSVCKAVEGELPTHCPNVPLTLEQLTAVNEGRLDYKYGMWIEELTTVIIEGTSMVKYAVFQSQISKRWYWEKLVYHKYTNTWIPLKISRPFPTEQAINKALEAKRELYGQKELRKTCN